MFSSKGPIDTIGNLKGKDNYHTLKSTFIMSASSIVNIFLGIIRNKLIAVLLNPSGMGIMGIYQSLSNLAVTISGLGVNESGARQVALAYQSGDNQLISRTFLALKRTAFVTGILGTFLLLLASGKVSILTFGNTEHFHSIQLLSFTILFGTISGGQIALIQGARKIPYLANINVLGPLFGTLISLPIIYFFGMRGIVSYLIIMAATNLLASWWYSKKIQIPELQPSWRDSFAESKPLVGLGLALMIGNLIGFGEAYLIRILLIRFLDLDAAGLFQAASLLATVYVGLIFKAMSADFYPRLSAVSSDNRECNMLVNQQIEASLLLAIPGILATIAFAPIVMKVFYSAKFFPAVELLRWQIIGVLLTVVAWPMGYVLRAKAAGKLFVGTQLFGTLTYLLAAWIGAKYIGLRGVGIAFLVYNSLYLAVIYWIMHRKYAFSLLRKNERILIISLVATIASLSSTFILPAYSFFLNFIIAAGAAFYSYKQLALSQWLRGFFLKLKRKSR